MGHATNGYGIVAPAVEVLEMCNKDAAFDATFEAGCASAALTSSAVVADNFPTKLATAEGYEMHCINLASYKTPAEVEMIQGRSKEDSGVKMLDRLDPSGGQAKGKLVCTYAETKYELSTS